jgi:uncharacterized protein (DUF4415 family)
MKPATTLKPPKTTSNKLLDPDNPPWTEEMLGPPVMRRGLKQRDSVNKVVVTIKIDADILAWFKSQGAAYERNINDALRHEMENRLTKPSSGRANGARR